jgi:nitrogen fixation NifU-like protein
VYSPQVLDHFERPRHVGDLEQPTASAELSNPACGDVLRISLRVVEGRIVEVRYKAKGCVPAIACGSALTELLSGRTVSEARALRPDQLVNYLGGLPSASLHASHLAMDALAAALRML